MPNAANTSRSARLNENEPRPPSVLLRDRRALVIGIGMFLLFFLLPNQNLRFHNSIYEALALTKWYAQEHVILCLVPAFFIAGAIAARFGHEVSGC